MSSCTTEATQLPQLFTPTEVAKLLHLSPNTVISRFAGRQGVVVIPCHGTEEQREQYRQRQEANGRCVRTRERYRRILIPRPVLDKFIEENTVLQSTAVNKAANRKRLKVQRSQDANRA